MSPLARTVANRMAEGGLGLAGGLAGLWIAVNVPRSGELGTGFAIRQLGGRRAFRRICSASR